MFGFDTINYSLRPNKVIQRNLAFDGLQRLSSVIPISKMKYIGFGSVWFADFIMAHKQLGIADMISIERDPVTFVRAKFNSPFRTIRVVEGDSTTILGRLTKNRRARVKPWILWLDYTSSLTPEVVDDIDLIVDHAPENSVLLVTINVMGRAVGSGLEGRRDALRKLLGDVVADDAPLVTFQEDALPETVASYVSTYIDARCKTFARKPGWIPAFTMPYRDNAQMVTVGGILPSAATVAEISSIISEAEWPGFPTVPVETPPLTPKELGALQRVLPAKAPLTRADLRRLGFDLEDGMLDVYCAHYRRYPSFFQVVG
jgi:hypothetical protein